MSRRRKITIACWVGGLGVLWICNLGLHFSLYVRAYCRGHEAYGQPEVYVSMNNYIKYQNIGIPGVLTLYRDSLPYPLRIGVHVDDRLPGEGFVVDSMLIEYQNGEKLHVIDPASPRSGTFQAYEHVESDRIPGRTFRVGWLDVPSVIDRRESFKIIIMGHIPGETNTPFVRKLHMDYSRDFNIYSGWQLLAGASC